MTATEYNRCVDEYADSVYRFILKNVRNVENAKDIVQETFTKMWEKTGEISYSKSKSYLFTAAYHTMIDFLRKEKPQTDVNDLRVSGGYEAGYSGLKEVIDEAVSKLPDIQRSVVMLRDYEGYSYEEIGEITGLSESQVKVYIFRARTFLKNYLVSIDNVI